MEVKIKSPERILDDTLRQHKPSLIVCSYSGGYDSMVATHKTIEWAKNHAHSTNIITIAVDTRLHADGWIEYVNQSSREIGAKRFEVWQTRLLDKWVNDVKERGFAYRKAQHKIYFYYLKQNAFRAITARYKKHTHDRIMFITGVRRLESKERANTPEYSRNGSNVWCNPLVYWSESDIHQYRIDHELPENPFYAQTRNSGDCLCNWHMNISMAILQKHGTEALEVIAPLDKQCRAQFGYGYGQEPSRYAKQEAAGQMRLIDFDDTPYLCAGCEKDEVNNEIREDVLMQRLEWK